MPLHRELFSVSFPVNVSFVPHIYVDQVLYISGLYDDEAYMLYQFISINQFFARKNHQEKVRLC